MTRKLEKSLRDRVATYASAGASAVPFVGGILGQAINDVIPNQRIDRIVEFVRLLEERLGTVEEQRTREVLDDSAKQDLIVMGGIQAARALSNDRLKYIAEAVANGIDSETASTVRKNRLLQMLGDLDDDEVAILHAYGESYGTGSTAGWDKIDRPKPAHLGSSTEQLDESRLYEAGRNRLLRLGLLERKYSSLKNGQLPEFDPRTGAFKGRIEISYLGRMLLREIGLPTQIDR